MVPSRSPIDTVTNFSSLRLKRATWRPGAEGSPSRQSAGTGPAGTGPAGTGPAGAAEGARTEGARRANHGPNHQEERQTGRAGRRLGQSAAGGAARAGRPPVARRCGREGIPPPPPPPPPSLRIYCARAGAGRAGSVPLRHLGEAEEGREGDAARAAGPGRRGGEGDHHAHLVGGEEELRR